MKHLPRPFLERPVWLQLAGAILGALGGNWRARQDRRPQGAEAL